MPIETKTVRYIHFLVGASALGAIARAMTLSFLAIKLQRDFGLGMATIGLILGAGPLIGSLVSPFAGSFSDKVGRKAVLTVTLAVKSLSLIGLGLADTVLAFSLSIIACCVAIAVYEPLSRALMSDVCPAPVRLKYFSWRYMASNVGWAVGPLIGVAAGTASSLLFLVAGVLFAAFSLAIHLLPVPRAEEVDEASKEKPVPVLESIGAAIRDPRLAFFVCGGTFLIAVYGQFSSTLAPYLAANVEDGVSIFAYLLSINGVVVLIGSPFARRFIERVGAHPALVVGCLLFLVSEIGFLLSPGFLTLALAMIIFTLAEILVVPAQYMLVDAIATDRNRGSYFGADSFAMVGNFLGPALGGAMLGAFGGTGLFLLLAGFAGLSAVLYTIGTRMPPPRAASRSASSSAIEGSLGSHLRGAYA